MKSPFEADVIIFGMNITAWKYFLNIKKHFKNYTEELFESLPDLKQIQQDFVNKRSDGKQSLYTIETPVVYNSALDDITIDSEIKMILVADNPGRREQAAENRRYLIGPSGKIAAKFFKDNPVLGIDFYKNVIILNKTPIHSPRTADLRRLSEQEFACKKLSNSKIKTAVEESQKKMALILFDFHKALDCPVWITGYSEMRKNGIFEVYTEEIKKLYENEIEMTKKLFFFRHFSMNQFTIDLKKQMLPDETVKKTLKRIGTAYRHRILDKN